MAKLNPFLTHHAAAGKAFSSGDHSKAMHHIGHMMLAVRAASKGTTPPASATDGPDAAQSMSAAEAGSDDDQSASLSPAGIATPAAQPAKKHFFGQFGQKATPKAAPHTPAPQSPLSATNHTASGGFNKARFAGFKK